MTDAVVTDAEAAAIPTAINVVGALEAFVTNVNLADPEGIPGRLPGALQVFLGTVEMQAPALAVAEGAALQSTVLARFAAWKASLTAMLPAA